MAAVDVDDIEWRYEGDSIVWRDRWCSVEESPDGRLLRLTPYEDEDDDAG